ncbi:MAG: hypothetical protein ACFFDT_33685, partial [Candidatus Hodarchaeota archaeon]
QVNTPERIEIFAKVNNKGQMTIPKQIREACTIQKSSQAYLSLDKTKKQLQLHYTEPTTSTPKTVKITKTYRFTFPKEVLAQLQLAGTIVSFKTNETQVITIEQAGHQVVTRVERL